MGGQASQFAAQMLFDFAECHIEVVHTLITAAMGDLETL